MQSDGNIFKMGFVSLCNKGSVEVALAIEGIVKDSYSSVLNAEKSKYITFSKPLEVKTSSVINFVSKVYMHLLSIVLSHY